MKDTKHTQGRRDLSYRGFDDWLADAERVTSCPHTTLGNWTTGEIIDHCARPIAWAMDGYPDGFKVPLMFKFLGPMLKNSLLAKTLSPGIKPPAQLMKHFEPTKGISIDDAMQTLRSSLERWPQSSPIPRNPVFGKMDKQQWEHFLCNHAAMHFSFIVPDQA